MSKSYPCAFCGAIYLRTAGMQKLCSALCRFQSKIDKNGPVPARAPHLGPCHVWTGCRNEFGYGEFGITSSDVRMAHRYAWELVHGPIPDGLYALHHCDNPACVRSEIDGGHVFVGDQQANMDDMIAKGRWGGGSIRLTEDQVREIRSLYVPGRVGFIALGRRFNVGKTTIEHVVRGRSWRHVT